jgi:hypothetical protein
MANSGKIDWHNFNFLENLLIHCTLSERDVPAESGVQFRIGKENKEDELCLIFKIDRRKDPLIKETTTRRPDYLVFYFNEKNKESPCIFTIVEMKGRAGKSLRGGLEQIKNLRDKIKREVAEHLPTKFKYKIQGILLSPYESQVPLKELTKESQNGFTIFSVKYSHKAELFGCVSKLNELTDKHDASIQVKDSEFNFIENLLANKVLTKRKKDKFFDSNFTPSKDREGVYLNYEFEKDEYLAMCADKSKMTLAIKESGKSNEEALTECLGNIGISLSNNFQISKIES